MTSIHAGTLKPQDLHRAAAAERPGRARRPRRARGIHGLAVGYRYMAWQALRKGDAAGAAMYAACSKTMRGESRQK